MAKYYTLTGIGKDLPKDERNEDNREVLFGAFSKDDVKYERDTYVDDYMKMKIEITQEAVLDKQQATDAYKGKYIITTDVIDDGERNTNPKLQGYDEIYKHGQTFKLFDDDDVLYFIGVCVHDDGEEMFAPLDAIGEEYGCTSIQYLNATTGKWDIV